MRFALSGERHEVTTEKRRGYWYAACGRHHSGKGTQGATTTHVGVEPSKGSITFSLPDETSIAAWAAFLALFRFDPTKGKGQAVTIYHPALASVQPPITSVVMTKHTTATPDDKGCGKVTIELLEYFAPKSTGATTAAGAKGYMQSGKGATGTQEDPAIAKLKAQAAKDERWQTDKNIRMAMKNAARPPTQPDETPRDEYGLEIARPTYGAAMENAVRQGMPKPDVTQTAKNTLASMDANEVATKAPVAGRWTERGFEEADEAAGVQAMDIQMARNLMEEGKLRQAPVGFGGLRNSFAGGY